MKYLNDSFEMIAIVQNKHQVTGEDMYRHHWVIKAHLIAIVHVHVGSANEMNENACAASINIWTVDENSIRIIYNVI